jgi:2'-5' RNA ligase
MPPEEHTGVSAVRNHWWWRPGWRTGRHFYACHLTTEGQPGLRDLVSHYQAALEGFPDLDLIPAPSLHLTTQGIGFADQISPADLATVTRQLQGRLAHVKPPEVTFGKPALWPEAVVLEAVPPQPLRELRLAIFDAVAASLGPEKFSEPRPEPGQFRPHLSIAYVNSDGPAQPIADAIDSATAREAAVTFTAAYVLEFHRDHRMYEWAQATPIPIGSRTARAG